MKVRMQQPWLERPVHHGAIVWRVRWQVESARAWGVDYGRLDCSMVLLHGQSDGTVWAALEIEASICRGPCTARSGCKTRSPRRCSTRSPTPNMVGWSYF